MTTPGYRPAQRPTYHHGHLRESLVDTAVALLSERGGGPFSLSEVARRLDVSSSAPYRHFASREALLAAVAERGYLRLIEEEDRPYPSGWGAGARLLLLCVRYVRFGVGNPALFGTMFQNRLGTMPNNIGLRSFQPFITAVTDAQRDGLLPAGEVRELSVAAWTALHGMTVISLQGGYGALGIDLTPAGLVHTYLGTLFPRLQDQVSAADLELSP